MSNEPYRAFTLRSGLKDPGVYGGQDRYKLLLGQCAKKRTSQLRRRSARDQFQWIITLQACSVNYHPQASEDMIIHGILYKPPLQLTLHPQAKPK